MRTLRRHLRQHRIAAMWLIAAALLMKLLVPAGFMPVLSGGSLTLALCSGHGVEPMSMAVAMAMPGMADHGKPDRTDKDDMPCGFGGHAPAAMAVVDPILLAAAILFIVAVSHRLPSSRPVSRASYLRPPLRGPPAIR